MSSERYLHDVRAPFSLSFLVFVSGDALRASFTYSARRRRLYWFVLGRDSAASASALSAGLAVGVLLCGCCGGGGGSWCAAGTAREGGGLWCASALPTREGTVGFGKAAGDCDAVRVGTYAVAV